MKCLEVISSEPEMFVSLATVFTVGVDAAWADAAPMRLMEPCVSGHPSASRKALVTGLALIESLPHTEVGKPPQTPWATLPHNMETNVREALRSPLVEEAFLEAVTEFLATLNEAAHVGPDDCCVSREQQADVCRWIHEHAPHHKRYIHSPLPRNIWDIAFIFRRWRKVEWRDAEGSPHTITLPATTRSDPRIGRTC